MQFLGLTNLLKAQPSKPIYDYTISSVSGEKIAMHEFKGSKLLLVNTASKCGFTPQYKDLENLYQKHKENNFIILAFPSNDFGAQEPGNNSEIEEFCKRNYDISFPITEKICVKGQHIHPIYEWLTSKKLNGYKNSSVRWNFQKYMIDENGNLVGILPSWKNPNCRKVRKWLENN